MSRAFPNLPTENRESLRNRKVCVTGRLIALTHDELARLVTACGGTFVRFPHRGSLILVVGQDGWPSENDGTPSRIFERARKLRALGFPIEFQTEDEFLQRLGVVQPREAIGNLLTITDLKQILQVSPAQVRRWVRAGLIEPVKQPCRLAYFDFHQVAFAKRLCELLASGVSLAAIRTGVEKVRRWQAEQHLPVVQWAKFADDGRVLTRLNDVLIDSHGQRYFNFNFEAAADENSAPLALASWTPPEDVSKLFDQAIQWEDAGDFEHAANLYRRAIELEPNDTVLHFNLGNVLYRQQQYELACQSFQRATQCDPEYAEAWNNLGSAWAALQQYEQAIAACRTAVSLLPNYADAHFNLAEWLQRMGQADDAARHREAYQSSSIADRFAQRRSEILRIFRDED